MATVAGQTIWLTGASSGIGLALAQELAGAGARLILTARSADKLHQLATELPGEHLVWPLDLSAPEAAAAEAKQRLADTRVDILINNAGVSQRSQVMATQLQVYRDLMELNYFSVVALTQQVLPQMIRRGAGKIVTVSSVAGKVGTKLRSGYAGAKFGVIGFMDCLRAEMAEHGVSALTVCPGFVQTNVAHNALTGDGQQSQQEDPEVAGGITATECARQIHRAIVKDQAEVIIGAGLSKLAPRLQRLFPGLVRRLVARR